MKRKLVIICSVLFMMVIVICCSNKAKSSKPNCDLKVKDITLSNRADTLSYALGTVWSNNIGKYIGINTISYAFYKGVQDYISADSSIMGIYAANNYLNMYQKDINYETFRTNNDSNMLVCDIDLKTRYDSFSYALGFCWCSGSYKIGIAEVTPALLLALPKCLLGDTSVFTNSQANNYLMAYIEELRLVKFANEKKINEQWLEENKKKPDVVVLPNGLQYKILTQGKGKSPAEDEVVECHYLSKLIDGTVIEDTYPAGKPVKLYISSTIDGLHQALKIMNEGAKWEVYMPYTMAYGSGGVENGVPSYSALVIEVELLKIHINKN